MPTLQFFLPDASTTYFELPESEKLTLGTSAENDLQIIDSSISRAHAELLREGNSYRIKDLGSTNKTWVNDVAVVDVPLKEGSTLRLGHVDGRFITKGTSPKELLPLAYLQITSGEQSGITHRFRATHITLGWKSQNIIRLKDPSVSGQHAEITCEKGRYRIKDLQSSNHTFLNDKPITEAELKDGDALRFGALEATFILPAQAPKSVSAPAPATTPTKKEDEAIRKLESENSALQKEIETLKAERKAAKEEKTRLEKLQSENTALQQEIETLKTEHKTAKEEKTRLEKLQSENSALQQEIETLKTEHKTAKEEKTRLGKLQSENTALQAEIATLKKDKENWEADSKKKAVASSDASNALEAAQKEIATLTKQLESTEAEATTLAAKLDDERQQSESIAATNTQLQLDLDLATSRIKDLEKRLAAVTEERDAAQQSVVELEHQYAALQAEHPAESSSGLAAKPAIAKEGKGSKTALKPAPATPQPVLAKSRSSAAATVKLESSPANLKEMIEEAPHAFSAMRKLLHTFIKNQRETTLLDQLLSSLHGLSRQADKAHLKGAVTMTRALEALINELITTPSQITSSSLRSISQSLDFLSTLFEEKNITRLQNPLNANIFAVDDDADARKVIRAAMEVIQLKVTCAEDPAATLAILDEQVFDLIFIDVGLPDMNGFELCTKIRALPQHRKTPVVFLTGAVTVQNRVQSSLSGGNDFIAKPFNLLELGVKALTWILKGQLGLP